jgi:hypothetical protein
MIAVAVLAGTMAAQAAPWLGLVKNGTTAQTNDTIALGTLTFSMDLRADTDSHNIYALQYGIATSSGTVTYGVTPLTALNNPFVAADLTGNGQAPGSGTVVNSGNWTVWWHSAGDFAPFAEQSLGTYQFNVSALLAGTYVFSLNNQELLNDVPGEDLTDVDFAPPGAFVLTVVPEPGAGGLLLCGSLAAAWRNRRRNTR